MSKCKFEHVREDQKHCLECGGNPDCCPYEKKRCIVCNTVNPIFQLACFHCEVPFGSISLNEPKKYKQLESLGIRYKLLVNKELLVFTVGDKCWKFDPHSKDFKEYNP